MALAAVVASLYIERLRAVVAGAAAFPGFHIIHSQHIGAFLHLKQCGMTLIALGFSMSFPVEDDFAAFLEFHALPGSDRECRSRQSQGKRKYRNRYDDELFHVYPHLLPSSASGPHTQSRLHAFFGDQ